MVGQQTPAAWLKDPEAIRAYASANGYPTVHCYVCGPSFTTAVRIPSGGGRFSFSDTSAPCAICGTQADIVDGTYGMVDGLLQRIGGAKPSFREIRALQDALSAPASADPVVARAAVESAVPRLAPLLNNYWGLTPENWLTVLKALLKMLPVLLLMLGQPFFAGAAQAASVGADPVIDNAIKNSEKRKRRARRTKKKPKRKP